MTQQVPKRRSQTRFSKAPTADISRSVFDLSHPYKTTLDSGLIYPIFCEEIVPGDTFRVRMSALCRLATPLHPTMDNLHITSHFFFVPNRLVWDNWQKFMGEQDNPGDSTDFTIPQITTNNYPVGSIYDYFNLPTDVTGYSHSALPLRAYGLIWNEWYRDENLKNSLVVNTGDGPDSPGAYLLLRRGKRKDYISSALPWPQKGPGVDLPLGQTAPVVTSLTEISGAREPLKWGSASTGTPSLDGRNLGIASEGHTGTYADSLTGADKVYPINLEADLSQATASTINDLRQAFQIQKLQERDARGGTRYTEIIKSHFRVTSPDARLQRPEFLGGGQSAIQMNSVPQTSSTDATTPQGNLTAYAQTTMTGHGFTKSFVEHGYVLGLISVRADLNYQNRIDRHWSRATKYDFYWPALQAIGEQAVLNKEVWVDGTSTDDEVWGYQERWSEMRSRLGKICGKFRSNAAGSLDPWHYAIDFATRPTLDATFVDDNPPIARTIAVQSEPEFLFDAWFDVKATRPMPVYSVPGYIDHF